MVHDFLPKKKPLTASISCSKIKHPLFLFSLSSFLLFFFFKISATFFFFTWNRTQTIFFLTQSLKDTRNKNNNKNTNVTRTRTKQRHKQERNKTQTRKTNNYSCDLLKIPEYRTDTPPDQEETVPDEALSPNQKEPDKN